MKNEFVFGTTLVIALIVSALAIACMFPFESAISALVIALLNN